MSKIQLPREINREDFAVIELLLEQAGRPRKLDLYEIFCAILYVLKEGVSWQQLPADYPSWHSVYKYWRKWSKPDPTNGISLFEQALRRSGWNGPLHRQLASGSPLPISTAKTTSTIESDQTIIIRQHWQKSFTCKNFTKQMP